MIVRDLGAKESVEAFARIQATAMPIEDFSIFSDT
jgi:hypothetical protein